MAKKQKGEVVATVREWEPQHDESLAKIQHSVDALGRAPGEPAPPPRDHAAIAAAVDRLTRRVKTRKVVVKETVTEYVDAEGPVAVHAASKSHAVDVPSTPTTPVEEGKKGGFFSRFKKGKGAPEATETHLHVTSAAPAPAPATAAPTPPAPGDAWDPSTIPAVSAPKPLQSKAAKRTAGKPKKSSKKR